MRGRAHALLRDLQGRLGDKPFLLATVILRAQITPTRITPLVDDPELELRLARALDATPQ